MREEGLFEDNQLVFVYGSLRKGFGNNRLLQGQEFLRASATEDKFLMYSMGGFPAVDTSVDSNQIQGELYEVNPEGMARLDRLEGYPSFYDRKEVKLATGETAWVYFIDEFHKRYGSNYETVENGDWKEYRNAA